MTGADPSANQGPDQQASSPGAERVARHRRRRKKGLLCIMVELRQTEIDALIQRRRLAPESRGDLLAVRNALYGFLDDMLL
jgi:hypothetical protein